MTELIAVVLAADSADALGLASDVARAYEGAIAERQRIEDEAELAYRKAIADARVNARNWESVTGMSARVAETAAAIRLRGLEASARRYAQRAGAAHRGAGECYDAGRSARNR